MRLLRKAFLYSLLLTSICLTTLTARAFVVRNIRFVGLQRIASSTAVSYLPIRPNQELLPGDSNRVINRLYETGFFDDVKLGRDGNTLVISVRERPTFSNVTVVGNKDIPKKKLDEALGKLGLERGQVLNRSTLSEAVTALREQYYATGRYNATVEAQTTEQSRNRVDLVIKVSEGRIAKIRGVHIVGNRVFDEHTLLEQLPIKGPSLFSFITGSDQYAQQKLEMAKHALESYYMNNGYIMMKVDSTQVSLTPDRESVNIIFSITEGPKFRFGKPQLSGNLIVPAKQLQALVPFKPGETFSRAKVIQANQAIGNELGNYGYAFARVDVVPNVDMKNRLVDIDFKVEPGNKYYVRHIHFVGNPDTSNIALRNSLLQFEGGLYSSAKFNGSLRNLRQLPYLKQQEMSAKPRKVQGSDDKVDVDVKVAEQLSAQLNFSVGYSQSFGFLAGISFNQQNFMGTGKTVGASIQRSAYQTSYSINYTNPFFTASGISHSMSVFYQNTTPSDVNLTDYTTDVLGFTDSYGFPISNFQRFNLGYGYQNVSLKIGTPSAEISKFVNKHGSRFNQLLVTGGWNLNTTDRAIFPTKGFRENLGLVLSLPIGGSSLDYYTGTYQHRAYFPLGGGFVLSNYAVVGYGNGYGSFNSLPFFQNFYAGGLGVTGSNRAFSPNTLGPRDSRGNPLGGDLLISGSVGLVYPITEKVRAELFFDTGNVFNVNEAATTSVKPKFSNFRHSVGIQVDWWTPLGMPLTFSLAKPLRKKTGDDTQLFQFSIGGTF